MGIWNHFRRTRTLEWVLYFFLVSSKSRMITRKIMDVGSSLVCSGTGGGMAVRVVDMKLALFISSKVDFNRVILVVCSHHVEKEKRQRLDHLKTWAVKEM